jgi:hypothetical protein
MKTASSEGVVPKIEYGEKGFLFPFLEKRVKLWLERRLKARDASQDALLYDRAD